MAEKWIGATAQKKRFLYSSLGVNSFYWIENTEKSRGIIWKIELFFLSWPSFESVIGYFRFSFI